MAIRDIQREIRKSVRSDENYDRAKGVGATVAGAGLVAGGVPGETSDSSKFELRDIKRAHRKPKAAISSLRGGIFGYRADAHQRELDRATAEHASYAEHPKDQYWELKRGGAKGVIESEKKMIGQLKNARKVSNVALVGGTGTVLAANAMRNTNAHKKIKINKSDISKAKKKRRYQAQVAGGAALTAGSVVGARQLDKEGTKWATKAAENLDAAKKIAPGTGGWTNARSSHRVPHVKPDLTDEHVFSGENYNRVFSPEHTKEETAEVGRLRALSAKQRYWANTYGGNAKNVRRYGVPLGVAGMALGAKGVQRKTDRARFRAADYVAPTGVTRSSVQKNFTLMPIKKNFVLVPVRGLA